VFEEMGNGEKSGEWWKVVERNIQIKIDLRERGTDTQRTVCIIANARNTAVLGFVIFGGLGFELISQIFFK
jgi:hypothetical protein